MTLGQLATQEPNRKVRLIFKSARGTGMLETTAAYAANPNKSARYFPPEGESAAMLGWPEPFWYANEILHVHIL